MSYLELRQANIARNDEMLKALGFGTSTMLSTNENDDEAKKNRGDAGDGSDNDESPRKIKEKEEQELRVAEEKERGKLSQIKSAFVHRSEEVDQIWNYLDDNYMQSSTLVVYGPTGCGKSDVVGSVIRSRSSPHAIFRCSGFDSSKQLLKSLWYTIMLAIFENNGSSSPRAGGVRGRSRLIGTMKAPGSFEDFIHTIGEAAKTHERHFRFRLNMVLHQFGEVEMLEPGLGKRLLRMSDFCHPGIKLIATLRTPASTSVAFTSMIFAPYSTQQIEDILVGRVMHSGEKISRTALFALLRKTLPRLLQLTKHIGELYATVLVICKQAGGQVRIGGAGTKAGYSFPVAMRALNEALNLPSLHMPDNTAALRDTQASSDGKKTRKESNLAAVEQVINVTSLAGVSSCQELPSSWKYLVLASFLASNNPKDTDDFVFAMKKKGKRKKERTGAKRKAAEMENTGPQAFTFERLLSIFSQISIAGHAAGSKFLQRNQWEPMQVAKAVESKYGDAQLFAAVNDLEAQRFLTRASGWTLERPLYVSAVQEGMAREVSASINFDLNAYLH